MPQTVDIPGQGIAEFPDSMTPDDIKGVIDKKFFAQTPSLPTQEIHPNMGLADMLFDPETAQNLRGGIQDVVYSLPGMAAQIPKMAYEGLKFAVGGSQERAHIGEQALTEAVVQGNQMSKDAMSPVGSREFFRGWGNIGLMSAPAVGELVGEAALLGKEKPPIQAQPQIHETQISDAVQQPTGGIENAQQIISPAQVHGDVQYAPRPQESIGEMPANIGSEGVQARGQREIVQGQEGQVTLYHSTPKKFETFTGEGTPTGLGGKAHYFSAKPEPAYGENVVPVTVPKDKILDLSKPDIAYQNDAQIRKAGYEGTFNPSTGEYTVYDPNKFVQQTSQEVVSTVPQPEQPIETGARPATPVSEPTETTTAQPFTQDLGVETPPTVSETTPKGQAEPSEQPITYPEGEGRTTGIAQRITNVPSNEGLTVQESVDRGQNLLSGGVNPEEVSARVKTTKQLSVDDLSVLRAQTSELDKAAYAAEDAMRANPNDPVARKNWEDAVRARNDWNTDHVKPAQTIWSDLGRTQQGEADIDTGTVTGLRVAFNEAKGRDPTPAEQSKLTDYADKTQNVESQIDQAKSKYDQEIAKESGSGGVPTTEALQEHFLSKITDPNAKSYPFTQGEIADLWKYTKAIYIDKGVASLDDTIHMVSLDTGLRPEWVADALTKPKAIKSVTNELYSAMSKRRDIVNAAKDYIRAKDEPLWKRVAKAVWETPFSLAIYGHGTVGGITHAGANIFRPSVWSAYWPDFVNQAKFFAKPGIHEAAMQRLVRGENFITAKRAGLANDPNLTYTDYGAYAKFFGLQGGRRGFDALKTMRQSMFDSMWNKVPDSIKSDPQAAKEMAKGYADMVNHATGVISNTDRGFLGTSSRAMGPLMFAAKLEASRWARVIGDPVKTLDTYAQWSKATPAEKAVAIKRTKNAAEFATGFLGTLYLNQVILSANGSKDKINFSDPSKSDWLKHKIAGHTVAVDGGLLSPIRLLGRLTYDTLIRPRKELQGDTRTTAAIKDVGQYAIGKASPSVGIAKEAVTGESFEGRLLPWSRDTSKKPRMTWPEYAASHGPIPLSGGIRDTYDSMRDRGISKPDAEAVLRGLAAFGSELTGARVMEIQEPTSKKSENRPR